MAKKKVVKKSKVEVNPKTGRKAGSLGDEVGRAYLSRTTLEGSIGEVEKILAKVAKSKGKSESQAYVHGRAVSWVGFLQAKFPKLYPKREHALPKARSSSNGHQPAKDKEAKESSKLGASV